MGDATAPNSPQRAIAVHGPSREEPFPLDEGFMPTGAPQALGRLFQPSAGPRAPHQWPSCLAPQMALPSCPAIALSDASRSQDAG